MPPTTLRIYIPGHTLLAIHYFSNDRTTYVSITVLDINILELESNEVLVRILYPLRYILCESLLELRQFLQYLHDALTRIFPEEPPIFPPQTPPFPLGQHPEDWE